ncbi:MAG TPA: HlyD family type I secretion periplasmic adaptor subunit [Steroidobacteraceae bacterium]|nr:HlyD family type I secretion periplasmic adaptor subunit [Steroidobacteraceae bacterium]
MPSPKRLPPPTEVLDPHPDAPKLAIVKAEARGRELTPLEREFLPPLLEIQETPPSPVNRWVAGTLIVLVIALIVWATVGKVSIVATAPGKFIPDGRLKQIQPLESSIVRSIDVTEGQRVRKGQLLIELDPTLSAAALNANAQKYGFNRLEQARLVAELTDRKPDYTGLDEPRAEVLLEERIRRAQEQDYAAKLAEAQAAVEEKSAALAAAQASLTKYRQMTALAEEQVASARPLVPIGAISRIDYLKLEEALIQNRNDGVAEQRTVQQDQAALTEAQKALDQVRRDHRKDLYHDLARRVADEPTLRGDYDKSRRLYALEWLRSPVDGIVQSVNVTTVGQVVTPAQSLVTIVPDGTPLIVEATVSNNDIGYIRVGQPVQVKVDTFPFQQYGTLTGTLVWVSPDAEDRSAISQDIDTRTGAIAASSPEAPGHDKNAGFVYRVHIRVTHAQFLVNGQYRSVEPGMTVQADVLTGRRRVIEFFLSPVVKYLNEGVSVR